MKRNHLQKQMTIKHEKKHDEKSLKTPTYSIPSTFVCQTINIFKYAITL
jgi:hypothetical protein